MILCIVCNEIATVVRSKESVIRKGVRAMGEAGRPRKYKTVKELEEKIENYFNTCDIENRPYTVTGLAIALDMSRKMLLEYCDRVDENGDSFRNSIKKAKDRCEAKIEEGLLSGKYNATGAIFNLKNNYGWKDKQEVEQSGELNNTITVKIAGDASSWGK